MNNYIYLNHQRKQTKNLTYIEAFKLLINEVNNLQMYRITYSHPLARPNIITKEIAGFSDIDACKNARVEFKKEIKDYKVDKIEKI